MAITYEFIFRDGGSGSTPTSSGTIPVNPGTQPGSSTPDLPQSPPKPPSGASQAGGVTVAEVEQIVNRAADRQAEQRPQPPRQGDGSGQGQQSPQPTSQQQIVQPGQGGSPLPSPQQSPQPQRPAGEATLDAIREAANRAGGQTVQQPVQTPQQQDGSQGSQQAPTSPQLPAQPQQPASQPTPQVVQQFITQHSPTSSGQRALPEHPDLPSLREDSPPLPTPTSPEPPTQPAQNQDMQIRQALSQLVGGAGSAFSIPGSGAAAAAIGSTGPLAAGMAGIGIAGLAVDAYWRNSQDLASYSPEIAQAQAQQDVKEQMRLIEQARRYGAEDARTSAFWSDVRRSTYQGGVTLGREIATGNIFFQSPQETGTEVLLDAIAEFNRNLKGQFPSPMQQFMNQFDHVPDPWPFNENKGTTIHDGNEYDAVITGL